MIKKQKVFEIHCEIISDKPVNGPMVYFKEYSFEKMIGWVWRNCQGCNQIIILPDVKVIAEFEDRVEVYTLLETEIPSSVPIEN